MHVWTDLDPVGVAGSSGAEMLCLDLCCGTEALVHLRAADLSAFGTGMHATVPPGCETAHLDIDAALADFWAREQSQPEDSTPD